MHVGNTYMFTVSSCVWVRSGVEMMIVPCSIIEHKCRYCVVPLSWCPELKVVSEHGVDESVWIQDRRIKKRMKKIH
jgi:hypothetical protein